MIAKPIFIASLLALLQVGVASAAPTRLTEQAARAIAQKRVPNSAFEHADLEREDGRLIWSFDLRPNGSNDIVEIHIDAYSGEVVRTETETPTQQRAEEIKDAQERKQP
jgi:hypothetical protein